MCQTPWTRRLLRGPEQQGMAEVEAKLAEEDEALLVAAALEAMRFLGRQDRNHPEQYPASSCPAAHDTQRTDWLLLCR